MMNLQKIYSFNKPLRFTGSSTSRWANSGDRRAYGNVRCESTDFIQVEGLLLSVLPAREGYLKKKSASLRGMFRHGRIRFARGCAAF